MLFRSQQARKAVQRVALPAGEVVFVHFVLAGDDAGQDGVVGAVIVAQQLELVRPPNCSRRISCPRNLPFHTDCEVDGHSTGCLFRPVGGWEQLKEPPTVWHYGLSARYGRSESDVLHSSRIQSNVLPNCYQATDKPAQLCRN